MTQIIVVNKKPNITHLPYNLDGRKGVVSFVPGNNTVDEEILKAVMKEAGEKRWKLHYGQFLKPIAPAAPDKPVDPSTLSAEDAIDLINGTMQLNRLEEYAHAEQARKGGARKTVMDAIERQTAELSQIEEAKKVKK